MKYKNFLPGSRRPIKWLPGIRVYGFGRFKKRLFENQAHGSSRLKKRLSGIQTHGSGRFKKWLVKHENSRVLRRLHWLLLLVNEVAEYAIIFIFWVFSLYGGYTVYDTVHILESAEAVNYETYKPVSEDTRGFDDYRRINPDVMGWIEIYGTNIDYPLVWSPQFDKYLNLDPEGRFAIAGSIFLDNKNKPDMSDFKNIIYGHHMEAGKMFGHLDHFAKESFFKTHAYGTLYYGGKEHGLTIFAYLMADAYDMMVYDVAVEDGEDKAAFLDYVEELAVWRRDVPVTCEDTIVLMSTCAGETNGRYIVAAIVTEEIQDDPYYVEKIGINRLLHGPGMTLLQMLPGWWWGLFILAVLLFAVLIYRPWER